MKPIPTRAGQTLSPGGLLSRRPGQGVQLSPGGTLCRAPSNCPPGDTSTGGAEAPSRRRSTVPRGTLCRRRSTVPRGDTSPGGAEAPAGGVQLSPGGTLCRRRSTVPRGDTSTGGAEVPSRRRSTVPRGDTQSHAGLYSPRLVTLCNLPNPTSKWSPSPLAWVTFAPSGEQFENEKLNKNKCL